MKINNEELYFDPITLEHTVRAEEFKNMNHILTLILTHLQKYISVTLNNDEECLKAQAIYTSAYNLLMTIVINFKKCDKEIYKLINSMIEVFSQSPFENHFLGLYLFEQGQLTQQQFAEVYDEFHCTEDSLKFTFYEFFSSGYG
jgi:hypothetical protein